MGYNVNAQEVEVVAVAVVGDSYNSKLIDRVEVVDVVGLFDQRLNYQYHQHQVSASFAYS